MTVDVLLQNFTCPPTRGVSEANLRLLVGLAGIILGVISAWLLDRRSHTREDRARVLTALPAARRPPLPDSMQLRRP